MCSKTVLDPKESFLGEYFKGARDNFLGSREHFLVARVARVARKRFLVARIRLLVVRENLLITRASFFDPSEHLLGATEGFHDSRKRKFVAREVFLVQEVLLGYYKVF